MVFENLGCVGDKRGGCVCLVCVCLVFVHECLLVLCGYCCVGVVGGRGVLPRELLQVLCAGASGLVSTPACMWSAVMSLRSVKGLPHRWQWVAVSCRYLRCFLYSVVRYRVREFFCWSIFLRRSCSCSSQ